MEQTQRRVSSITRRDENTIAWGVLEEQWPEFTRIELFDMAWWMHFRDEEKRRGRSRNGSRAARASQ